MHEYKEVKAVIWTDMQLTTLRDFDFHTVHDFIVILTSTTLMVSSQHTVLYIHYITAA